MENISMCKQIQKDTGESMKDLNSYLTSLANKV